MRRRDAMQGSMFLYGSVEERVPARHPPRRIRPIVDAVLKEMSPWFSKLYSKTGRPSIPLERRARGERDGRIARGGRVRAGARARLSRREARQPDA